MSTHAICTSTTVVASNEVGAILKYPPSLHVTLVQTPYGQSRAVNKRKRTKRPDRSLNKGEADSQQHHTEIVDRLLSGYQSLLSLGSQSGYFPVESQPHIPQHQDVDLVSLCELDALVPSQESTSPYVLSGDEDNVELFGHVISNRESRDLTMTSLGVEFRVPQHSSFLLSDVSKAELLLTLPRPLYGLIVLDPPWENRSAIRGKKYSWLSNKTILGLPVPRLLLDGALVAVWVTNKRSVAQFVRAELFPHWRIGYLAEWHWIKVTTEGQLVWPMDSTHKKPYETLLIGRYKESVKPNPIINKSDRPCQTSTVQESTPPTKQSPTIDESSSPTLPPAKRQRFSDKQLPKQFIIVAVPSSVHSQKPYLGDLLEQFAPNGGQLELFARNLLPSWTSWGNEVLKFQVTGAASRD